MASLVLFTCKQCGLVKKGAKHSSKLLFCSNKCQHAYTNAEYIKRWQEGTESSVRGMSVSGTIRKWLFEQHNSKCQRCGWCEVNEATGRVPLQVDHIDGDWKNASPSNLRLLCPNCHSLTPTFGSLNRGKGRKERKR